MTAKIVTVDIERQSCLVDGVWEAGDKRFIRPEQIVEPSRSICLAYQWISGYENDTKVHFAAEWDWKGFQDNTSATPGGGHRKLIELSRDLMDDADFIVSWNGKTFDLPHLRGAQILYDLKPPSPHIDIDLMREVKAQGKMMYYRLGVLSKQLGLEGKAETGGEALWRNLRFGQGDVLNRARRQMKHYNETDVQRTTDAYHRLQPWLKSTNLHLYEDPHSDDFSEPRCPNCLSWNIQRRGIRRTKTRAYQQYCCNSCGKWSKSAKSLYGTETVGI